mgnify:CR=1 FL=1
MYFPNTPITMEAPFNKQDEIIKKLLQEAPLEKPSLDFSKKVMQQIEKQKASQSYRPLISKTAWGAIAAIFMLGLLWVYFNPASNMYDVGNLTFTEKLNIKYPFEGLTLSKTTAYAIGVMALFLLQIPFLKRILEKNHL